MELGYLLNRRTATAAILVAAVVLSVVAVLWLEMSPVAAVASPREFTIQPGWGGGRIASELKQAGLIRSTFAMIVVTNWTDTGDILKAGTYLLSPDMTTPEIVRIIAAGQALSTDIVVTIPEGMNVWEIDGLLQQKRFIVAGSFARTWQTSEGMLWPDTYRFDPAVASSAASFANARTVGAVFVRAFTAKALVYSKNQIIVASILEKEAKSADDMALVSGIIARRLKLGMPLQVDATVAYGWCLARWLPMSSTRNCDVTQAPLATQTKVDGPYNTYARIGLPVGPISNPGRQALEAAAHPKDSPYLYYLSTRDGSQLIYAATLAEHQANRHTYLGL